MRIQSIFCAAFAAFIAAAAVASAQSGCSIFYYGNVPTPAQWNACLQTKQDTLNFMPLNRGGDTMAGRLVTTPPTTARAGFNLAPGTAPTSPVDGDVWVTSAGIFGQFNGQTVLLSSTPTRIAFYATVDFNQANHDNAIALTLPPGFTRFLVASVRISGASHDLSTATAGLFTAATGGGVAVVTAATAITVTSTSDSTNNNSQSMTINNPDTRSYTLGAVPNVYFRTATAEGSAATATVSVSIIPLP